MKQTEEIKMAYESDFYVHASDEAALKALKAIPGFHQLARAFMKIWSERQFRITNMSSCVRVNENQLSGHLCRCTGYENILNALEKVVGVHTSLKQTEK